MLTRSVLVVAAAALLAGGAVACRSAAVDDGAASADQLATEARKGSEFVRCWTTSDGNADTFFRNYAVTCHVSSSGLGAVPKSVVDVDVSSASGRVISGTPSDKVDQDVVLGNVHLSDFPLQVRVYGLWLSAPSTSVSAFRIQVPAAETANATAPVVVKMPFDAWPVTILNQLPLAALSAAPYTVEAAPFFTQQDESSTKTSFSTTPDLGVITKPRADYTLVAPTTGGIDVDVQTSQGSTRAKISAPGVYVVDGSGLRLATADEEAAAASSSPSSPASPPSPPADGGAADSAPATPAPTCGDPGQQPCKASGTSSCNAGSRYDGNYGKCVACGQDGQPACYLDPNHFSSSQGLACNEGTRYDGNYGKCVACGNAGQTFCYLDPNHYTSSQGLKCNDGTRYDGSIGHCVPCGAAGQTACYADPNNYSSSQGLACGDGLHVSNGLCQP